jgi:SpoVK/Ycf46/Vps4 family AAA+-type ATPase
MSNNNPNPNDPHIKVIMTNDPSIMECLPPQLREMIQRDLGGGGGNIPPKQEEVEEEPQAPKEKIKFDFGMVNSNQDLKNLTKKLKASKQTNYGILLYGESGCGKSYYGQYLAQELGMPIIKRRASDLIDKFVGQTEKNIKDAFIEAKQKKAVLLFDEADSFLFDRKYAQRDFECASTNELLTQMEDHSYPFIMTTNLKEKIDKASLRRFLFKIKYDYMTEKNIISGVKTYFGKEFSLTKEQLKELKYVTAGDFKTAKRKMDVLEDSKYSNEKIYEYLLAEQAEKDIKTSESINL